MEGCFGFFFLLLFGMKLLLKLVLSQHDWNHCQFSSVKWPYLPVRDMYSSGFHYLFSIPIKVS